MNRSPLFSDSLYKHILGRVKAATDESYTASLLHKGKSAILKKIGEETTEVIMASMTKNTTHTISEIADLYYHLNVLLIHDQITPEDIAGELEKRTGMSGLEEKRNRTIHP